MLANLVSIGQVAVTYRNDIEQLLVLLPQATAVQAGGDVPNMGTKQAYRGYYLDFNLNLNLPHYVPPASCRLSSTECPK